MDKPRGENELAAFYKRGFEKWSRMKAVDNLGTYLVVCAAMLPHADIVCIATGIPPDNVYVREDCCPDIVFMMDGPPPDDFPDNLPPMAQRVYRRGTIK